MRRTVLRVAGVALAPGICYETIFPGNARVALELAPDGVLLNPANGLWLGKTAENDRLLTLQVPRAIENRTCSCRGELRVLGLRGPRGAGRPPGGR